VAQAVHIAVSRGGDRVAVHLEPEHLGRVEVILSRDAGGVTAHLRVESPQAHQALASELPALRQALEARGVSLVHVQVDLDDHSQGGQRPGREAGGRRRRGASGGGPGELAQDLLTGAERWRPWGFEALI
jgi:flagellar hook-length control protein FliK